MKCFSKTKLKLAIIPFLISFLILPALGGEGMWLPLLLETLNEEEMQSMGMQMNAEDIYSVNQGSLKDAIVHFNGSCTAAVISNQGLILTNHHCGYNAIHAQSTVETNYLKNGFWAQSLAEEIPSPGVYARFIVRMEDITKNVLDGIDHTLDETTRQSEIDKNLARISTGVQKEAWQDVLIKPFFEGNQYFLFITETYTDVRYVGSPPEAIGKFGADTDNWVWPRHAGDFSLFRIYAGTDNRPADFSPNNQPLKPKRFLPISLDGIDKGDFTLVYGFPARTNQYLPSFALAQTVETVNPEKIAVRDLSLGIMGKYMREDDEVRLAYASKYNAIANYWKKYIGQVEGIERTDAIEAKINQELAFTAEIDKSKKLSNAYAEILPKMKVLYMDLESVARNKAILEEIIGGRNIELFKLAAYAEGLYNTYQGYGDIGYDHAKAYTINNINNYFSDYIEEIDQSLFTTLMPYMAVTMDPVYLPDVIPIQPNTKAAEEWAEKVFSKTSLTDKDKFIDAINNGGAAFSKWLESDTAFQVYIRLKDIYKNKLTLYNTALYDQIKPLQRAYVSALMEVFPDHRYWPDGNSTLRVTYGQVEGFSPRDGLEYKTQTYLEGVMEKYVPGDYEFDVPQKLIDLYTAQDYGHYGEEGKMPVDFMASNHTTNGNSGSPAIDGEGNLIGLNFDRVWEGTMSDLYYDESICRNIMVDARYILFIIDKFGGASHLIAEMKLVHPKA